VKIPENYPWTGHLSYLGQDKNSLADVALILGQLGKIKALAR